MTKSIKSTELNQSVKVQSVKAISLKIKRNGIANLTFDLKDEKVNKLTAIVLMELEKVLDDIKEDKTIKALIIDSNKKDIFIAGADINQIKDIKDKNDAYKKARIGQNIFNKIESLPFVTIAVINGACLGGGLEMALACDYRVVTDHQKVKIGLPEVNLGIIPGFGGTQRLPRLVGLAESLKMILSGKALDAKKAYRIGLADIIIREEFLKDNLDIFINKILANTTHNHILTKRSKINKSRFIKETLLGGKYLIFHFAKKNLLNKTKGKYPAPLAALEVVKRTYNLSNNSVGLIIEAEEFSKLAITSICKNLIELFFLSEEIKKDSGIESDKKIDIKAINSAGLLGAGIMGGGIAWLFSNYNIAVRMKDINWDGIALGFKQIFKIYSQLKKIRKYNDNQINLKINNISATTDYSGFDNVDIVVEAIIEDIDIKKKSLQELEKYVDNDTLIVSNTSSLSITKMASSLKRADRFAGMHFFNPVNRMPLVEVIKGQKTSDKTIASIVILSKKMGKTPIVVKDTAGFLVNRILCPYINEAGFLLQEGANLKVVDKLIEDFGLPMGPFTLADNVGIDVGYKVSQILYKAYGSRMKVCDLLKEMAGNKILLGKKSSAGFFKYDKKGKNLGVNPLINTIINKIITTKNITKTNLSNEDIIDRSILIMVNEASRCLEEGVVKSAKSLDMAMIMGTGFPPFRGGLLRYADQLTIYRIVNRLKSLSKKYGDRFQPSKLLVTMDKKGRGFYS